MGVSFFNCAFLAFPPIIFVFECNVCDSGVTSLSEALKVNSTLTVLDLGVSLLLNEFLFKFYWEFHWRIRSILVDRDFKG